MGIALVMLLMLTLEGEIEPGTANEHPTSISFDRQVLPSLTQHGCNAGACHGAATGRGEFALSLFGSDPDADYEAIVHAYQGRRIRIGDPESSLLVAKPTLRVDHGGEQVLDPEGAAAQRLIAWIAQGAPRGERRELQSLDLLAERTSTEATTNTATESRYRLQAMARFSDGSIQEVTPWTHFVVDAAQAARWEPDTSTVVLGQPGFHPIVARYMHRVAPLLLVEPYAAKELHANAVRLEDERNTRESKGLAPDESHGIDQQLQLRWDSARVRPAATAEEFQWLRRVCLDLTGRLPTLEQLESFRGDTREDKRAQWVDRLMQTQAFEDYWTYRVARWFGLRGLANEPNATMAYGQWIRDGVARDRSLRDMAREALLSSGDSHEVGAANFARMASDARTHAELVASVFMGTRLQCAQCHNHPLDRWTRDDYHGLAAVFAGVERGRQVRVDGMGHVTNPRTQQPAIPRIPGVRNVHSPERGLEAFSEWLLDAENPHFAKGIANRLWQALMGRGLVDPIDDFRETNPASHPELLDALAYQFTASNHRLRPILKTIALSRGYALGTAPDLATVDERFFAQRISKSLPPEVLFDAIHDALGTAPKEAFDATATRAVQLLDPLSPQPSLDALGRCNRQTACDASTTAFGLARQLHWLNGPLVNDALHSGNTFFDVMLREGSPDAEILEHGYLRAYARPPSPEELGYWEAVIPSQPAERIAWYQDWMWSVLSSSEFLTNH